MATAIQKNRTAAEDSIRSLLARNDPTILGLIPEDERDSTLATVRSEGGAVAFAGLSKSTQENLIRRAAGAKYDAVRRSFKNTWNRTLLEMAAATSFVGTDSTGSAVHATIYSAWIEGGLKIGTMGQMLVGVNGNIARNASTHLMRDQSLAGGLRLYYGTNAVKVDAGFDLKATKDAASDYSGEAGAEVQLLPSVWLVPSATLTHSVARQAQVSVSFSVRYATLGVIPVFDKLAR